MRILNLKSTIKSFINGTTVHANENNICESPNAKNQQSKEVLILDDSFKNEDESFFKVFNDPFYVTWVEGESVILRYDPNLQNGIVTKNPINVFGGMDYIIKARQSSSAMVRIKDAETGDIYLSKYLPVNNYEDELNVRFNKDTQVNIHLTSPGTGDSKVFRFTFILKDL